MNQKANYIKQRLSLRIPQQEALDIVVKLTDVLELKKDADLAEELEKVKQEYSTCTDFERDFPSLAFSIATGIGKTRLMGACIAYLYLKHGIRNFFILAPNLTIYEKLIEDLGNPANIKYVFNGISEFVHNRPIIITGDNYSQQGTLFNEYEIRINVFNIAKFNSESRGNRSGGKSLAPRIKRFSEILGQSYWQYLTGIQDLVVFMDEAHRYHADASKNAINELNPVLGIELTATPIDEKGNTFKNVVYEYSLAKALDEGIYVKSPAIATRKNFRPQGLSEQEIERIKLEDAISLHEDTRNELELYSRNNNVRRVKPFVLVVCKNTTHAKETFDYINSTHFFNGRYNEKVLQIDSTTRKDEDIEKQFISLEQADNPIEIVIHVYMLKEGWDVNNLYTICPLNVANSVVLIEQTIGRGLRLPYNGQRTGVDKVDKLTVVAHDNFDKVITAAKDPNSILNKVSYIEIPEEDLRAQTTVVQSVSKVEADIKVEEKQVAAIIDPMQKQKAQNGLDAKKAIISVLPTFNASEGITKSADLAKPEVKLMVIEKVKQELNKGQLNVFATDIAREAEEIYDKVVTSYQQQTIDIPRMDLVQDDVKVWLENFDLDNSEGFDFNVLEEEIMIFDLKDSSTSTIGVRQGAFSQDTPTNQIISELINFPEIDYDENADLLQKLSSQAVSTLENRLPEKENLALLVRQYRKVIAGKIYDQIKTHFHISEPDYIQPTVFPFVKIEEWNFSTLTNAGRRDYRDVVSPTSLIPKLVFSGFEKACHFEYKFDSKTEKDFAQILEQDKKVLKWLRPAPNQFRIYWANNSRQYYPDFIVETEDAIYMVETKAKDQLSVAEVVDKARAAEKYCEYATIYTSANGAKPWKYLLIPHDEVQLNFSLDYYISRF